MSEKKDDSKTLDSSTSSKDLTSVLDLLPASESSISPSQSGISVSEESQSLQVDHFESIEEFSQSGSATETQATQPLPEPSLDAHPETPPLTEDPSFPISSSDELSALEQVKNFAETVSVGRPPVQAAFPFSVLITGTLRPEEREKLLDVIERHKMGIREADLNPQFEAGKILIPRISEYALVLIIQAMRGIQADIKFGPSDQIFEGESAQDDQVSRFAVPEGNAKIISESSHPAERIPLTNLASFPGELPYSVIDVLTASASLKCSAVEAESTNEYQELVENLKKELKYKAYRKGATGIVNFSIHLTPLAHPTQYRLSVMGSAVKSSATPSN